MESRFFYDIQKNINDKIYNEYIKFCKDNVNVSDPNQIIQMLVLKSRIVPTTDGTDHNLNNFIDSWIKDKMLSLINKFIPDPTAENIETFVDRLCKYLEVADICTRKNINLKSLHNPVLDKTHLSIINLKKIKITLNLKEKFTKIKFLIDRLNLTTSPYFNEVYDYVVKNQINENVRSITPSKSAKDIKQEEYGDRFIPRSAYTIYNKFDNLGLNIKKNSRGGSAKKQTNTKKNHIAQRKNKRNILRSNSAPKIFEDTTNESIKASDFESYYVPNSDRDYKHNHSKLNKNGAESYKRLNRFRFDKAIDALENEYNKLTGKNKKLWKELKDLKDKFKTWRNWKNKNKLTIPDENYEKFYEPVKKLFENEKKDWTKEIEKWQKNIKKLKNFKNYVVSTCGKIDKSKKDPFSSGEIDKSKKDPFSSGEIDKSKKDPFSTSKSSKYYKLIPSAERSQLEESIDYFMKTLKYVRDFEDRWDKDIEAFNSGKENKDAYSSFVQKFTVDGLDSTISDDIEKIKKDIYGLKDRNGSLETRTWNLNRCISQIAQSINKLITSVYADNHKEVPTWMSINLDISFNSFKDIQPEPDILRKEICGSRRNCSNLRKCISKFLTSSEFKKLESNKTKARKCRNIKRILEFYSESSELIDHYLADIQNQDKATFGPAIRKVDKSIAKKMDVWMDMPMWRLKNNRPYLRYQDVEQGGGIGNCWLSATLKSMAKKTPDTLLNVFVNRDKEIGVQKTNSKNITFHNELAQFPLNPNITVRLYKVEETGDEYKTNGKYVDIQVPATLLQDKSGNPHWNKGSVLWPHIIEKAVEKYFEEFMPGKGNGKGKRIHGGISALAAALLSGKSQKYNSIDSQSDPQKTLDLLDNLLKSGKSVMCGTKEFKEKDDDHSENRKILEWQRVTKQEAMKYTSKNWRSSIDEEDNWCYEIPKRIIWGPHAYFLDQIEKTTPIEKTKIHLINPWGVKDDKVGRNKIYVTLTEFLENFRHVDSEN